MRLWGTSAEAWSRSSVTYKSNLLLNFMIGKGRIAVKAICRINTTKAWGLRKRKREEGRINWTID